MELLERVGSAAWTVGLGPRGKRLVDELLERRSLRAAEAIQRMTVMGDISQHLLTLLSGLIEEEVADLAECDATTAVLVAHSSSGRRKAERVT